MRLLLLAPPGAGKGTQARRLSQYYGIEHISTGDLLRNEVAAGTPCGHEAKAYLDRGDLVPDDLLRDIVMERVTAADVKGGFILDGYPRNLTQAAEANRMAQETGITLDKAVYLDVIRDELLRRLRGRGGTEARSDYNDETIRHRLEVFDSQTRPLVDYFRQRGLLIWVDGEKAVQQVTEDIVNQLPPLPAATPTPGPDRSPPDDGSR